MAARRGGRSRRLADVGRVEGEMPAERKRIVRHLGTTGAKQAEAGSAKPTLLIGCGALAREIQWAIKSGGWSQMELTCLPADLHNKPMLITEEVRTKIHAAKDSGRFGNILCLYGDCGTGGDLDRMLAEEGVERISGMHCYEFYVGQPNFDTLVDEEVATFFLTDYLVRFFDRLVIKGLGLDRFPHLRDDYFGNYKRVVYLAQTEDASLQEQAKAAAETLGLAYEYRYSGMDEITAFLVNAAGDPREHSA